MSLSLVLHLHTHISSTLIHIQIPPCSLKRVSRIAQTEASPKVQLDARLMAANAVHL
jgi:hypothetical protein